MPSPLPMDFFRWAKMTPLQRLSTRRRTAVLASLQGITTPALWPVARVAARQGVLPMPDHPPVSPDVTRTLFTGLVSVMPCTVHPPSYSIAHTRWVPQVHVGVHARLIPGVQAHATATSATYGMLQHHYWRVHGRCSWALDGPPEACGHVLAACAATLRRYPGTTIPKLDKSGCSLLEARSNPERLRRGDVLNPRPVSRYR